MLNFLLLFFSLSFRPRTARSMCFETVFSIVFTRLFSSVCPSPTYMGSWIEDVFFDPYAYTHAHTFMRCSCRQLLWAATSVASNYTRSAVELRRSGKEESNWRFSLLKKKKRTNPETARKGRKYIFVRFNLPSSRIQSPGGIIVAMGTSGIFVAFVCDRHFVDRHPVPANTVL